MKRFNYINVLYNIKRYYTNISLSPQCVEMLKNKKRSEHANIFLTHCKYACGERIRTLIHVIFNARVFEYPVNTRIYNPYICLLKTRMFNSLIHGSRVA